MKTALVVIDVQNFFINEFTKHIPQRIHTFIDLHKFDLLCFSRFINTINSNWYRAGWKNMILNEETEIASELLKYSNVNNTFSKTAFSVFTIAEFINTLKENSITDMYICGLDTHACIYATALDAYSKGYTVHIIADLCAASHGVKYHTQAIEMLK